MSRLEVLEKLYDEQMQKVFTLSGNWLMTIPKKGFEKEWAEASEIAEVLAELVKKENGGRK